MLHFEQIIDCPTEYFAAFGIPAEQVLFFDIETTGFSPEHSYVYLIGCAFLKDKVVTLRQWFLEDIVGEKELVQKFGEFSSNFQLLVHYNGTTFDLPYLQKKARRYQLSKKYFYVENTGAESKTEEVMPQSLDIYKYLIPYKKLFKLKDLKQKTVEQLLNIKRKDTLNGGDLILLYTQFVGRYRYECIAQENPFSDMTKTTPKRLKMPDFCDTGLTKMPKSSAKVLLFTLLLHNREDIAGQILISALLALPRLLDGDFTVAKHDGEFLRQPAERVPFPLYKIHLNTKLNALLISTCFAAETKKQLPADAMPADEIPAFISLSAADAPGILLLSIPIISGTLKYFFGNHKDYYYLPMEDCAMHKSVAQFVEKKYRRQATKETCYQKKESLFLPQPKELFTPVFRLHAKNRFSFFEFTDPASLSMDDLKSWVQALLQWLFE